MDFLLWLFFSDYWRWSWIAWSGFTDNVFNDFPEFTNWTDISYVTTGWGIRNLAMAGAMILALWLKTPSAIGVVFTMGFLTEAGDLINTLVTGHGSMGAPLIVVVIAWIVVFLIPEVLAARWGITRVLVNKANGDLDYLRQYNCPVLHVSVER